MQKIQISDRAWLEPLFQRLESTLSEYSFGNAFLFQPTHYYEWFELNNRKYIKGLSYTSEWFLIPLFLPTVNDLEELKYALFQTNAQYIYPISDDMKVLFDTTQWNAESLESESDYLYTTESIRTYAGRSMDGRRNLVHQFLAHKVNSLDIAESNLTDAKLILTEWFKEMQTAENEVAACMQALVNWSQLALIGRITYADDKPVGLTIGEKLNNNTFVLHFAKGVGKEKGIYQYIYQDLATVLPEEFTYLNWEQDLGLTGLRKAKEAYKPLSHLKKWRLSPK